MGLVCGQVGRFKPHWTRHMLRQRGSHRPEQRGIFFFFFTWINSEFPHASNADSWEQSVVGIQAVFAIRVMKSSWFFTNYNEAKVTFLFGVLVKIFINIFMEYVCVYVYIHIYKYILNLRVYICINVCARGTHIHIYIHIYIYLFTKKYF